MWTITSTIGALSEPQGLCFSQIAAHILEDPSQMALTNVQLEEMRKVLHHHAIMLERTLESDDFWTNDLHIAVATQLRVLLCDRDLPIMLTYAELKGIRLRVWGPRPPGSGLSTQLLFNWTALVASWTPAPGAYEMSIQEYLDTGIAVIPVGGVGRAFSPRQIIKWVANKEGGAHFSLNKPATLAMLKQSTWRSGKTLVTSFQVKQILLSVGLWTHTAIGHCLGIVPPNYA